MRKEDSCQGAELRSDGFGQRAETGKYIFHGLTYSLLKNITFHPFSPLLLLQQNNAAVYGSVTKSEFSSEKCHTIINTPLNGI